MDFKKYFGDLIFCFILYFYSLNSKEKRKSNLDKDMFLNCTLSSINQNIRACELHKVKNFFLHAFSFALLFLKRNYVGKSGQAFKYKKFRTKQKTSKAGEKFVVLLLLS